jgi:hypothetical protein
VRHGGDPVDQVAEVVRQVDVVALLEPVPGEVAVPAEGDLLDEVQPQRVGPKRCTASSGSIAVPSDLLIFSPLKWTQPWPKICFGSGSPALISIAGQMTRGTA